MKKKNLLTAAASLALVAVIGVGATLAYFTDKTDAKTNVFTTGKVDITLIDETDKVDGWKQGEKGEDGILYEEVMPGDILSKRVGFSTAADSSDCYVALKVDVNVVAMPNATEKVNETTLRDELIAQIEKQAIADHDVVALWTQAEDTEDGSLVFYYNTMVPGGINNIVLFDHVKAPETWGNEYASANFTIDVQAFAVQAANLTAPTVEGSTAVRELNALIQATPEMLG